MPEGGAENGAASTARLYLVANDPSPRMSTCCSQLTRALFLGALLGLALPVIQPGPVRAQESVTVQIEDATVSPADTATVPLRIGNLDDAEDVNSYELDLEFDEIAITYVGFAIDGTLSGKANFTMAENKEGARVAGFSPTPLNSISDAGILLKVKLKVVSPGEHVVSVEGLQFNEGTPPADPTVPEFILSGSTLRINEVLPVPPSGPAGDANGDGVSDAEDDEFIEIYNTSTTTSVDLGRYEIRTDGVGRRHVFPDGTELKPEEAVVVFGGGAPADSIPGVVQTASRGGLEFFNSGETIRVENPFGGQVLAFSYADSIVGESITREPDFTGPFVPHTEATPGRLFSPGRTTRGAPLPVELVTFQGQVRENVVHLRWVTASETNNAGFRVQRRAENIGGRQEGQSPSWQTLGFVESTAETGTTSRRTAYQFMVEDVETGTHHFRLEQVDHDGTVRRFGPLSVVVPMRKAVRLRGPRPNPASGPATVAFAVQRRTDVRLTLYDLLGRHVRTVFEGTPAPEERHTLRLRTATLPPGTYFLRLRAGKNTERRRLTVVR